MIGLVELVDEHRPSVEYDLIGLGLRWRDFPSPGFTWRDLLVVVQEAPRGSALYRAVAGESWLRSPELDLLRNMEHSLRVLYWMRTREGSRGQNWPKPVRLPWDEPEHDTPDAMSLQEVLDWLGWSAPT